MPEPIPEIELDPNIGPILRMKSPDGNTIRNLEIDNGGELCLGGAPAETGLPEFKQASVSAQTSTDGWTTKLSISDTFNGGNYILMLSFNWRTNATSVDFKAKIELDDNIEWEMTQRPKNSSSLQLIPSAKYIPLAISSGSSTINLMFSPSNKQKLAYMSDVFMAIWRV